MNRLIVVLLSLCLWLLPAAAQDEVQQERFLLTYIPNIQFAPTYVAIAKGYFAEQGLEIQVEHLNEPDVVDLVASGQANFRIVSGEQLIHARAQGRPVVSVYEWFQQYPVGVVVSDASGIESVKDLAGKKVGIPGRFGASYTGFTTLLLVNGMTESDVVLEEIGFNAPEVFCLGAIDAAIVYVNNEPLQIEARIAQSDCGDLTGVHVLLISDEADLVSNGLLTSEMTIKDHPESVEAMVNAYNQALRDVIRNPAEAYLLSMEFVENLDMSEEWVQTLEELSAQQMSFLESDPTREEIAASRDAMYATLESQFDTQDLLQFAILLRSIELWDADQLGYSDLSSWEVMQATLIEMGMVSEPIELEFAFTNAFLPVPK
ncbi:ABC transporter substrate-binding protein [Anaerolineales bacterium]